MNELQRLVTNYKQSKKLKELCVSQIIENGGWAYKEGDPTELHLMRDDADTGYFMGNDYESDYYAHEWVKAFALQELIEVMGDKFEGLKPPHRSLPIIGWQALGFIEDNYYICSSELLIDAVFNLTVKILTKVKSPDQADLTDISG